MTKEQIRRLIREFSRDWRPAANFVSPYGLAVRNVRPAEGLERCCACVGDDPQSGPVYCGDLADVTADVADAAGEGCRVSYCARHKRRMEDHEAGA